MQRRSSEYEPAEDTFFIAEYIEHESGQTALDVGSGSGYLTRLLCGNFSLVVGTDIDYEVLRYQTYKTENLVCCNGADALRCGFDLIVCNMPYLATDKITDIATDGGRGGFEVPKKIIDSIYQNMTDDGKFVFVTTSLSDFNRIINYGDKVGLSCKIVARKKLFFEELLLIEATKG